MITHPRDQEPFAGQDKRKLLRAEGLPARGSGSPAAREVSFGQGPRGLERQKDQKGGMSPDPSSTGTR